MNLSNRSVPSSVNLYDVVNGKFLFDMNLLNSFEIENVKRKDEDGREYLRLFIRFDFFDTNLNSYLSNKLKYKKPELKNDLVKELYEKMDKVKRKNELHDEYKQVESETEFAGNINYSGKQIRVDQGYFSGERFSLIADSEFASKESGEYVPVQYVMPLIEVERVPDHTLQSEGECAKFEYVFRIYNSGSLFYSIMVDERTEREREEEKHEKIEKFYKEAQEVIDIVKNGQEKSECLSSPFEPEEKFINFNITVNIKEDFNPEDLLNSFNKELQKIVNKVGI